MFGLDHYNGTISSQDIDSIFLNLDAILPLNQRLLSEIEEALAAWDDSTSIGSIFVKIAPFLKIYNEYGRRLNVALTTLSQCYKNEIFKELVEGIDNSTKLTARLEGLLHAPIQRIPKYVLLLEELYKNTSVTHHDYEYLEKAIVLMENVENSMKDTIKQGEDEAKLMNSVPGAQVSKTCIIWCVNSKEIE